MKTALFVVLFLVVLPLNVKADDKAKKVQKLNFTEENVDGKIRQPDGSYIVQKRGIEFVPMYKLRENFDEQIQESIEYIK